ncbi:MAG: energy-coupling factor ABC transporter ATP-binding protein [Treponema sp.]|nr:energy-coupling factor ABC transporter ATP-binding protein [Treponema sp.]
MNEENGLINIINFNNISYKYPDTEVNALKEISFCVYSGEFIAIMGENGCGKTTLCKLINGIIPHFYGGKLTGSITVDGICTKESTVAKLAHKAGMVFDDPDVQLFTSTVRDEAAFGPENLLLPVQEIIDRVEYALSVTGLTGFEDRSPVTLSGGEKQRLCIAAIIAMKSKIIVLDEPLCRLDPDGADEFLSVLKRLKEKYQITVIMAAHESEKMAEYADRVCILKQGRIAALDTAKNIFENSELLESTGIRPINRRNSHRGTEAQSFLNNSSSTSVSTVSPCLRVSNLCYMYPNGGGIENINLAIYENDFIAITGKNGCGKTTLLKNITGLLRPCSGDIFLHGRNIKEMTIGDISKEVGFVMQNPDTQLFTDSVYNEVAFALKNKRLPKMEIKKRVEEALDTVGLSKPEDFPFALCKTERTKIVIACVLAMGCKIIIFDEVDVGNDYRGCLEIMSITNDLHKKGFTIIFVTHNMFLVDDFAHRVIRLDKTGIISDTRKQYE